MHRTHPCSGAMYFTSILYISVLIIHTQPCLKW